MRTALDHTTYVLVLTGAGISAESGVPTFRDAGGLWEGHDVTAVASPEGFARDPLLVWRFYSQRRAAMTGIEPNAAHRALVELEHRLGDRFLLATQNVDGLHRAAGSERIVEMHGALMRSRCTRCERPAFADTTAYRSNVAPLCGQCSARGTDALLRPDIVWFGERRDRHLGARASGGGARRRDQAGGRDELARQPRGVGERVALRSRRARPGHARGAGALRVKGGRVPGMTDAGPRSNRLALIVVIAPIVAIVVMTLVLYFAWS